MPKGKHSASITWTEAVSRYGETALTAGVKEKTWRWWKTHGYVPSHRIQALMALDVRPMAARSGDPVESLADSLRESFSTIAPQVSPDLLAHLGGQLALLAELARRRTSESTARPLPHDAASAPIAPPEVIVRTKVDLAQAQVARLFFQRRPEVWGILVDILNKAVPPETIVRNPDLLPDPPPQHAKDVVREDARPRKRGKR